MKCSCLRRFWISLEGPQNIGVTARDSAEAVELAREVADDMGWAFEVEEVVQDIDVSTLDPNHILPNIGPPSNFGVWFPRRNI